MRRAFVLLTLLFLLGCGNPPRPAAVPHGIYLSPDPAAKISLKVPENWELREGLDRVPLVAMSPVVKGRTFRESLTVVTVPLQADETPGQFIARSLAEATKQLKNVRPLVARDPEHWAYYQHDYGGQTIEVMAYFLTREQLGYVFAFSCSPADADAARPLFEAIARTISVEPTEFDLMKDLRDSLQKHDNVITDIKLGIKK